MKPLKKILATLLVIMFSFLLILPSNAIHAKPPTKQSEQANVKQTSKIVKSKDTVKTVSSPTPRAATSFVTAIANDKAVTGLSINGQTFKVYKLFDAEKSGSSYTYTTTSSDSKMTSLLTDFKAQGSNGEEWLKNEGRDKALEVLNGNLLTMESTQMAQNEKANLTVNFNGNKGGCYMVVGTTQHLDGNIYQMAPAFFTITPDDLKNIQLTFQAKKTSVALLKNDPTISGLSVNGQTFTLYKVFDAEKTDNGYSYSTTSSDANVTALLEAFKKDGKVDNAKLKDGVDKGWFIKESTKVMTDEKGQLSINYTDNKGGFYFLVGTAKVSDSRSLTIYSSFTLTPQENTDKILTLTPPTSSTFTLKNKPFDTTVNIDTQSFDIYRVFDAEKTADGYIFSTTSANSDVKALLNDLNTTGKVESTKLENGIKNGWFTKLDTQIAKGEEVSLPITFENNKGGYYVVVGKAQMDANKLTDVTPIAFAITPQDYTRAEVDLDFTYVPEARPVFFPTTGGFGTTLFFVIGGLLMVGAVAILISRKRHSNDSDEE